MMILRNHSASPPTAHTASESGPPCIAIPGVAASVPWSNPPNALGIYKAGPDDPIPAGQRRTGWAYELRAVGAETLSIRVPVAEPIPLAEVQEALIEASKAECARRITEQIDPDDPVRAVGKGIMVRAGDYGPEPQGHYLAWWRRNVEAHQAYHEAVLAATTVADAYAVPAEDWPEWEPMP